jgi:hypothetical protein
MAPESTRNYFLEQILIAEGGTPGFNDAMDVLLSKIVIAAGGSVTQEGVRNYLLDDYLEAKGGARTPIGTPRNTILCEIINLLIVIECDLPRNPLLTLWQAAIEGNILGDPWNDIQTWDDTLTWIETQIGAFSIGFSQGFEIT